MSFLFAVAVLNLRADVVAICRGKMTMAQAARRRVLLTEQAAPRLNEADAFLESLVSKGPGGPAEPSCYRIYADVTASKLPENFDIVLCPWPMYRHSKASTCVRTAY